MLGTMPFVLSAGAISFAVLFGLEFHPFFLILLPLALVAIAYWLLFLSWWYRYPLPYTRTLRLGMFIIAIGVPLGFFIATSFIGPDSSIFYTVQNLLVTIAVMFVPYGLFMGYALLRQPEATPAPLQQ